MKSILVDALREANGGKTDSTSSDSGSFDASGEDFSKTANDEHVVDDGELELMSTTDSLQLPSEPEDYAGQGDQDEETAADSEIDASHAITIVGELPRPVPPQKAPAVARFAPLACVLLALATGASWILVDHLIIVPPVAVIDSQGRSEGLAGKPGETGNATDIAPNFPFIDFEQGTFDEELTR